MPNPLRTLAAALALPALAAAIAAGSTDRSAIAPPGGALKYPVARRDSHVDDYHGTPVADPYRWMENIDSPETRRWVAAEQRLSRAYLDALPGRSAIALRLRKIWNFEKWTPPKRYGNHWFYTHNDGLQNQPVVFVMDDPGGAGRPLLDPNTLSSDGTAALNETAVSDDGRLFAYAVSDAGSDWQIWHVRDVDTGKDLPDLVRWSKFGGASWRKDGSGFYYTAYDPPKAGEEFKAVSEYQKLYFHRLGTPQSEDTLIYTRQDNPNWGISSSVTDDGRYLVIQVSLGTDERNTVLVQDLARPEAPVVPIVPEPTATFDVIGNVGSTLIVRTDESAPRYRVIAIDLAQADPTHWRTLVAEGADTARAATLVGGEIILQRLKDAHSAVERYDLEGRPLGEVPLPGLGTASGFDGHASDTQTFFQFSGYATPPTIYRVTLPDGKASLWRAPQLQGFSPPEFETRQVFCTSKDGTRVPIFITARVGMAQDGSNPAILYGYGGFNIPETPEFSPAVAAWLEMGGVYAVANLARRRRVRPRLARGGHEDSQAKRVRRFHRGRRVPDAHHAGRPQGTSPSTAAPTAGCWSARCSNSVPTVRGRRRAGGGRDGHAALQPNSRSARRGSRITAPSRIPRNSARCAPTRRCTTCVRA